MKKQLKLAKRYAKTLLDVSGAENAERSIAEATAVSKLMSESKELKATLTGPQFSGAEKSKVIAELGALMKCSEGTVKFLTYLSEIGAIGVLDEIVKTATALYLERVNMAKAVVVTAVEMGKDYEARLMAALQKVTGRQMVVEYKIDPSLIGGVLVQVGSTMYDGSIKGQLRLLKDELVKG